MLGSSLALFDLSLDCAVTFVSGPSLALCSCASLVLRASSMMIFPIVVVLYANYVSLGESIFVLGIINQ